MKWAATFGQKYNDPELTHPINPEIRGNSYVVFEADSEDYARQVMFSHYGDKWSCVYPYDDEFMRDINEFGLKRAEF